VGEFRAVRVRSVTFFDSRQDADRPPSELGILHFVFLG